MEYTNLTNSYLFEYECILNNQISENILKLNNELIKLKNELYSELINSIIIEIKTRIEKNSKGYLNFLIKNLKEKSKILQNSDELFYIQLNERDFEYFPKLKKELNLNNLNLDNKPLLEIGGFRLFNKQNTIFIDFTIEELIRVNNDLIKSLFSKIFPKYVGKIKSASELIKERELRKLLEIPIEIKEYIQNNNIKIQI